MRLAIYHNLPSGGAKRSLREMTSRLQASHAIDIYTLSSADLTFADLRSHCRAHKIYEFEPASSFKRPLGRLNQLVRAFDLIRLEGTNREIAQEIDQEGYDIVFVHGCRYGQSPSILRHLKTPAVYYCQEPPRHFSEPPIFREYASLSGYQRIGNMLDPMPSFYRRTLLRYDLENVKHAQSILVNSAYSRERIYQLYGHLARIAYLGVDSELFRPGESDGKSGVLFVGAVTPRKGIDFIVHSLALIPAIDRPALMIISNYAEEMELGYIQQLASQKNVSLKIRMNVSDDDLVKAYHQALVTLYAPVMEPFGLVPLESMACGTPVIGVNEAGVRESIQHERTGLLVDRDPVEFARSVHHLLHDPQLRRVMGDQGKIYARSEWSWEKSISEIEQHLLDCANGSNRGSIET